MPTERPSPTGLDDRTESLDEPTGSIEFGPRRAAIPHQQSDAMGEDAKPASSSNLAGREDAAVRKAEARPRSRPGTRWSLRDLWQRLRHRTA
jgi:hypothetical protein